MHPPSPTRRRRLSLAALPVAWGLLAPVAGHAAAPAWLPAQTLSSAAQFSPTLRAALPSDGSAIVGWTRGPFDANRDETPTALEASVRAATPDTGAAWPLASPVAGADVTGLDLATSASGDVFVVIAQSGVVRLAYRPAGAVRFQDLGPLSDGPVGSSPVPRIGVNAAGDVVASWHDIFTRHAAARVRRADGTLSPVQELTGGGTASRNDATIDEQGRATVVWSETGSPDTRVLAATAGPDGIFAAPVPVAPQLAARQDLPQVVHAADGTTVVAFASRGELMVARRPAGGERFDRHETVTGETRLSTYDSPAHQLLIDDRGTVNVLWHSGTHAAPGGVYVARRAHDDRAFGMPITVLPATTQLVRASSGAVDAAGRTLVAWWQRPAVGVGTTVEAAWIEPDGTVGAPRTVASADDLSGCSGGCPSLRSTHTAVSPDGDGIVTWTRNLAAGGWVTESAGYDATGPLVAVAADATTARVGQPVALSADARDRWSGVASVDWALGDGTTAVGPLVRHAFDRPGDYRVRVTARDALGLATTGERTITVVADPLWPDEQHPLPLGPDAPASTPIPPVPVAPVERPRAPGRPTITTARGPQRIDGRRRVRVATIACPPAHGACTVTVPQRVTLRVGTRRLAATVLAPRRIAAGKHATVRLRLPTTLTRTKTRPVVVATTRLTVRHGTTRTTKSVRTQIVRKR